MRYHTGADRLFRRTYRTKQRALGRFALSLQDITAAAGRIGPAFYKRYAILFAGIPCGIGRPQLQSRLGNTAQTAPFGITGFHDVCHEFFCCPASFSCYDAGIAVFKERFPLLYFLQDDGKGRHQFLCRKAGDDAGNALLHHGFTISGSHDSTDMAGI